MTLHIIAATHQQAIDYGKDLGFTLAAIKPIQSAYQLASAFRPQVHVLPEARDLRNYHDLIRAAERQQAVITYAEEA